MAQKGTRRFEKPDRLQGATRFSDDRASWSTLELVRQLKRQPQFLRPLLDATEIDKNWGRRREPGAWALIYLAFANSRQVDLEPWWAESSDELWQACGFPARRPYQTTYDRFCELETCLEGFSDSAALLIQHCVKHEPRIGAHVHADSTEAQSHAALIHDCPADSPCWAEEEERRQRRDLPPPRLQRATTERAAKERQQVTDNTPEDKEDEAALLIGDAQELEHKAKGIRLKVGGCWYLCRDGDAGVRAYTSADGGLRTFWTGYYNQKAIDHFTGAPLTIAVESASVNEAKIYPQLLTRVIDALGQAPQTIIADRGFAFANVFEANTRRGVASVIPSRAPIASTDFADHDRHGIPRCKHCQGPTRFSAFRADDPRGPRLWFWCEQPQSEACKKKQSMLCSKDWRLLVPLWRTDPLYQELLGSHLACSEAPHNYLRSRYKIAGKTLAERPKRIGRGWQQLRSNAAVLIEWFRIAYRQGWLGSARRNNLGVVSCPGNGEGKLADLLKERTELGLDRPYGEKAWQLGLGPREAPSERAKAPPGKGAAGSYKAGKPKS